MLRSFVNLTEAPLGYEVDRVVTALMPISFRHFPDLEARLGVQRDAMARVRALPGRAVEVRPLRELVRESVAETRFTMLVLGTFAAAAVLLAAIGLYGTLVYLASQRAREFGIRLALGANRRDILALVGREGLRLAVVGIAIGLAGALMTAQLMRHLLYGVRPFDGATITAVAVIAAALATAACLKPAWNAAAVDPVRMLRSD